MKAKHVWFSSTIFCVNFFTYSNLLFVYLYFHIQMKLTLINRRNKILIFWIMIWKFFPHRVLNDVKASLKLKQFQRMRIGIFYAYHQFHINLNAIEEWISFLCVWLDGIRKYHPFKIANFDAFFDQVRYCPSKIEFECIFPSLTLSNAIW